MKSLSRFQEADLDALQISRMYSEEMKKPFIVSVGRFSGWDCQSTDGTIRLEIKREETPKRTGNVCIEYWNSHLDKPSGVLSTDCTLWVHIIPENDGWIAIEYDIDRLRKLIIETGTRNSNGRDSLFKLIPVEIFKKYAKRIIPYDRLWKLSMIEGNEKPEKQ